MLPVYTRVTLHSLVSRPELNGHEGFVATPVGETGRYGVLLDGKVVPLNLQPACLRGITRVEPLPAYLGCEWTPGPPDAGLTVQSRILGNNETTESVGLSAETRYYPVPVSIVLMMNSHPDEYDVLLKLLTTDFTRPRHKFTRYRGCASFSGTTGLRARCKVWTFRAHRAGA